MRVTREQAQQNRESVVEAAGRLFRERGFDGVGVAELMKTVGLTHGGFYGQFGSKDELAAEACALAFERSTENWKRAVAKAPDAGPATIANFYLAPAHRDQPGNGCVAAALAGDVAREGPLVRQVFQDGVESLVDVLAQTLPERTAKARRRHALATFSAMVGAVVLARAVADEEFSQEILDAAKESL